MVEQLEFTLGEKITSVNGNKYPAESISPFSFVQNPTGTRHFKKNMFVLDKVLTDRSCTLTVASSVPLDLDYSEHERLYSISSPTEPTELSIDAYLYSQGCKIHKVEPVIAKPVHTDCKCCGHPFIEGEEIFKLYIMSNPVNSNFRFIRKPVQPREVNISIHRNPKQCKSGIAFIRKLIRSQNL